MKMSRNDLKNIVKECLIELLSEGLGSSVNFPIAENTMMKPSISGTAKNHSSRRRSESDPMLDRRVEPVRNASSALKEAIRRESGGNPIIADILADTARTTLPNMLQHGDVGSPSSPGSGPTSQLTQQEQFNGTPDQVFGEENASKWASLAFMDFPAKKTA